MLTYREAYVQMKMKEKGIEDTKIYREGEGGGGGGGHQKSGGKWNAFRELEKQAKGHLPDFAKIPDTVEIVGTRPKISNAAHGKGGGKNKREREEDDDEDEKATKAVKQEVSLTTILAITSCRVYADLSPSNSRTKKSSWMWTPSLEKSWTSPKSPLASKAL